MRVKRDATKFKPISIVLETRNEVDNMINALTRASQGPVGQDLYDFIEALRSTLNIVVSAPAQAEVETDYELKYPR